MLNKVYRKLPAGVGLLGGKWGEGADGGREVELLLLLGKSLNTREPDQVDKF